MLKRLCASLLVLTYFVSACPSVMGDDGVPFYPDLFRTDSNLVILINLAPFVSSSRLDKMQEGIDLAFEYRLTLVHPRQFWRDKTITTVSDAVRLSYQILTKNYCLSSSDALLPDGRKFPSLAKLHRYLSDSVVVDLATSNKLDSLQEYILQAKLSCIQLTSFTPIPKDSTWTFSESPVKYLFKQFLELTGFGRQEYSMQTRPFMLSEIPYRH
ncbi:MAG: DUF4390 domain-containing protein [candidate division Zixibacteria bacterium]|nr:DUF4390 domain-containing protein [candidate division Zixibacteria bacterium]